VEGNPLVLLVVEDNPDHTELIIRSLQDRRVANTIHHVSDGQAALDYLYRQGRYEDERLSPRPDLVLLDLRLPKVDGLEVLRRVKSDPATKHIPVVILTTSEADRDLEAAYTHQANSYLVKPVEFEQFVQLMNDLGFYWLVWNRRPNN